MARMTAAQEAAYALNNRIGRDDVRPDARAEYDR